MNDPEANILAALIGSLIGSISVVFVSHWLQRRSEKFQQHENTVHRYLLQLQDSVETLWYRCKNLRDNGGKIVMSNIYYEMTMLYSLGRVFAFNRIMLLDGIYSEIEQHKKNLGDSLRTKLTDMEYNLDKIRGLRLYRYDRLSLAESVMSIEQDRRQISTYLDFRRNYENPNSMLKELLKPAHKFITDLQPSHVDNIMKELAELANILAKETKIETGIPHLAE